MAVLAALQKLGNKLQDAMETGAEYTTKGFDTIAPYIQGANVAANQIGTAFLGGDQPANKWDRLLVQQPKSAGFFTRLAQTGAQSRLAADEERKLDEERQSKINLQKAQAGAYEAQSTEREASARYKLAKINIEQEKNRLLGEKQAYTAAALKDKTAAEIEKMRGDLELRKKEFDLKVQEEMRKAYNEAQGLELDARLADIKQQQADADEAYKRNLAALNSAYADRARDEAQGYTIKEETLSNDSVAVIKKSDGTVVRVPAKLFLDAMKNKATGEIFVNQWNLDPGFYDHYINGIDPSMVTFEDASKTTTKTTTKTPVGGGKSDLSKAEKRADGKIHIKRNGHKGWIFPADFNPDTDVVI